MLSSPAIAVEGTVGDGFAEVVGVDVGCGFEVGDGTGHTKDAVVGTGAESQAVHRHFHDIAAFVGENTVLARQFATHLGVAMDPRSVGETDRLNGACSDDTLSYCGAAFGLLLFVQLTDGHRRNFDVYVDAVHQGPADLVEIALHGTGRTSAGDGGVVVVAAWTGIHGGDEHKGGGVVDGHFGAADGHAALLHGLPQHLQYRPLELRQLIQERNTIKII